MINNSNIRDRFLLCINEIPETLDEVASKINSNKSYLSQLKNKENPEIKAIVIAKFCHTYGYSPHYILLGEGSKKAKGPRSKEEKLIDLVGDLLDALIELKPKWNDPQKELAQRAKKASKNN